MSNLFYVENILDSVTINKRWENISAIQGEEGSEDDKPTLIFRDSIVPSEEKFRWFMPNFLSIFF